jgi:hypothetical protein
MRIAIADNNSGKFTTDLMNYWSLNHEVKYERGASEHLAQWADVYYVDTWDNNIHYLYKLYHGLHDDMPPNWDNNKKPKIIVRALDWEVWIGMARDQKIIDWVDQVIVITPHIEEELRKHGDFGNKIKLIKPGVNLDRFHFKQAITDGFQIGMVLGDMWWPKNHMGGLDIFTTLYDKDKRWRLHIRGQHEGGNDYWKRMYEHYLESRGIKDVVTLYEHVEDMDLWYEKIDYLLHPGMKEAFCYAVGEAMAKGIKPIVNNFLGAEDIWGSEYTYNTHHEAINEFANSIKPHIDYRHFIQDNYDAKRMYKEYDELL